MELGGNANASAYLKKLGREGFEGYKNDFSKKYELQLGKKVADRLREEASAGPADLDPEPPVSVSRKAQEKPVEPAEAEETQQAEEASGQKPAEQGGFKAKKFAVAFTPK